MWPSSFMTIRPQLQTKNIDYIVTFFGLGRLIKFKIYTNTFTIVYRRMEVFVKVFRGNIIVKDTHGHLLPSKVTVIGYTSAV